MHLNAEQVDSLLRLDLFEAGWLDEGYFPGQAMRQMAMSSLAKSFLKKFHNDETDYDRDYKALILFLENNELCRDFGGALPQTMLQEYVINEMKSIIYDFFNPRPGKVPVAKVDEFTLYRDREPFLLNLSDIAIHFGFGDGSNIGSSSTDAYTKFCNSTMSHTDPSLLVLYKHAISGDPLLSDIESFRQKNYGSEVVRGNKLSFVPKSALISRSICTEPLLNMLFQKGIGGVIEGRLYEVFNIDIKSQQPVNSTLARIGSELGNFGTIDLSSASDTISVSLLRGLLPREPFDWLMKCRSPNTILPDGREIELHMISSMGNGFTFPLQTMIFASLVAAVYKVLDIPLQKRVHGSKQGVLYPGNFSVYGDDIIVDCRAYNTVVDCLELLGFKVNRDKSYNLGFFRESCGRDYFRGHNIRGVYLQKLKTPGDYYSAINRLNYWSAFHGILLTRTIQALRGAVAFRGVPYDESDDAGIKIPFSCIRHPRTDRNGAVKYSALVPVARRCPIPAADSREVDSPEEVDARFTQKYLRDFRYTASGILFSLLAGWIRNGRIGLRSSCPKVAIKRRVCPGWDSAIPRYVERRTFREEWKIFTDTNLNSESTERLDSYEA